MKTVTLSLSVQEGKILKIGLLKINWTSDWLRIYFIFNTILFCHRQFNGYDKLIEQFIVLLILYNNYRIYLSISNKLHMNTYVFNN